MTTYILQSAEVYDIGGKPIKIAQIVNLPERPMKGDIISLVRTDKGRTLDLVSKDRLIFCVEGVILTDNPPNVIVKVNTPMVDVWLKQLYVQQLEEKS